MSNTPRQGEAQDISVLLVFFTRYRQFSEVFEAVRRAKPSRLFLFQDGPRPGNPDDPEGIRKCREIAESVDWECEVFRNYNEKNLGPDEAGYRADVWAFSHTDKCIVLEDDVLPSDTFIPFCREMLDRYENDPEVMLISGFNPMEKTPEVKEDILFTSATFTWGWASWKRVVDGWDEKYSWLDDPAKVSAVQSYADSHGVMKNLVNICRKHREKGYPHFETVLISNQYLRGGLTLSPKVNMISNIGVVKGAAHYQDDISLIPKGYRRLFTMGRYDLDTSGIKCPEGISEYTPYREKTYRIYGWGHPFVKLWRFLEGSFYQIRAGNAGYVWKDFKDKIRNVFYRLNT
ncbi:MAG: hypothetical protein K5668_09345 [Lachnospiraceae bacterium]|nr:hypothetical protein [Lachnospiraceae bacterium]